MPCIFGEEKNQEALICKCFCVFFVFGREEKCVENVQAESRQPGSLLFLVWKVPGAFHSPDPLFEAVALQGPPPSSGLIGLILKPLERS